MSYTTVEAVKGLVGDGFTDSEITQAISDAEAIVAPMKLSLHGTTTRALTNKLIDDQADFEARQVQTGAKVWKWQNGEYKETTVTSVDSPVQIGVADDLFTLGEKYYIEDKIRCELAERYKAASLLVEKKRGERSAQFAPGERVTLGPATISSSGGSVSGTLITLGENQFERTFRSIVGGGVW
jgi:hypothetical protein